MKFIFDSHEEIRDYATNTLHMVSAPVQAADQPAYIDNSGLHPVDVQQIRQPLPTTAVAQEYTQDQISVAMAGLVSQGKQPEIVALIQGFGVNSLVELPKEQYGTLAVKLREMGAQI